MEVQRELEQDLTAIKAEQAHSKTETENLIAAAKKVKAPKPLFGFIFPPL